MRSKKHEKKGERERRGRQGQGGKEEKEHCLNKGGNGGEDQGRREAIKYKAKTSEDQEHARLEIRW